jgi:hypothetical protein
LEGAYIASGSIITEDVPNDALAIARSRQVNKEQWAARRRPTVPEPPPVAPPAPEQGKTAAKRSRYYRRRLEEFTALLETSASEESYQRFLEQNHWLLGSHYEDCLPKMRAGAEYVPDFVLERTDGLYEVVEIKLPTSPLFVRNGASLVESAELKRALSQLFDYLEYYKTYYLSESKIHSRDFKVTGGRLVLGRTKTQEEKDRLRSINERYRGVNICAYDDLVAGAVSLIKLVEKDHLSDDEDRPLT